MEEKNIRIEQLMIFTILCVLLFFAAYSMITDGVWLYTFRLGQLSEGKEVHFTYYSSYIFMGIGPFALILTIWVYYLRRMVFTYKLRKSSLRSDKMV